jgi:formylmethanofuran dehydrogenase subunit C
MSNDAQKQPISQSLNNMAFRNAQDATEHLGYSLPCEIVTVNHDKNTVEVKFDVTSGWTIPNVIIPIAMCEYVRIPYQVGDKGYCNAMDTRTKDSNLVQVGNLTGLIFVPMSQASWSTTDKDRLTLYGKTAVDIKGTSGGTVTITVEDNKVTITGDVMITGKVSIKGDVSVTGKITATGDVTAGIISLEQHKHGGVYSGASLTTSSVP